VTIALFFYIVAGLGITVGFHRYFTTGRSRPSGACASRSR
jgi:fatty-acid desaturase